MNVTRDNFEHINNLKPSILLFFIVSALAIGGSSTPASMDMMTTNHYETAMAVAINAELPEPAEHPIIMLVSENATSTSDPGGGSANQSTSTNPDPENPGDGLNSSGKRAVITISHELLDDEGNAVLVARHVDHAGSTHLVLVKTDAFREVRWTTYLGIAAAGNGLQMFHLNGDLFLAGSFTEFGDTNGSAFGDIFLAGLDGVTGQINWQKRVGGSGQDLIHDLIVNGDMLVMDAVFISRDRLGFTQTNERNFRIAYSLYGEFLEAFAIENN